MVSRGFTLVAIVAIALLAVFHQGVALKCRQCSSLTNENCSDNPDRIEPTECKSSPTPLPTTTTPPTSETTPTSAATTTAQPPATTITQPPPTQPPTTQPPTTQPPTTRPQPTQPPTTQPPTTQPPTTQPPTTRPQPTQPPTTQPPTTQPPTTQPPTTRPQPTQPPTTQPPTTQPPTTQPPTTQPPTTQPPTTQPSTNGSGDGQNGNFRRRRNVMAEDSETVCYKLVFKSGNDDVVERGCYAKENACEKLKLVDGRSDADCYLCEKDGCNASSTLTLGILSIFAPVVLLAVFRW